MYEPFFQLNQRTFLPGASASRFFPAAAIEQSRQTLVRCIQRAQGTGLLVGPTGTGKTLLCNVLVQQFTTTHRAVSLAGAKLCTRRALLQCILFELGLPFREQAEGELRLALVSHLEPATDASAGLLLVVDEADTLPLRLLEELRMLTNLVRDGVPRVQLVLAGGPALEERLANPRFESFSQRIAARCYLQPLNRDETLNYIAWQVEVAGGQLSHVFDQSALDAAYEATDGIPRLINQVCDYALQVAAAAGRQPLSADSIRRAWSELQQLPSPWTAHDAGSELAAAAADSPSMIEFHVLDDLPPFSADSPLVRDEQPFVVHELDLDAASAPATIRAASDVPIDSTRDATIEVAAEAAIDALAASTTEATVGAFLALDAGDAPALTSLAIVGDDFSWPVIPLSESSEGPDLRVVRAEPIERPAPDVPDAPGASEAAAENDKPTRQFDQLFTRLRRRRSA